jgi:transposase-like protein
MANHFRAATRQAWAERIERFEHAGQTVAQFCAAEGVSAACFYQWRRKLRSGAPATQPLAGFLPVKLQNSSQAQPATVMSVELPGGVRIRFEVNAGNQAAS